MKIVGILAAAAALALTATAASAGGFKYGSLGGNHGTYANVGVASFGSAKITSGRSHGHKKYRSKKKWGGNSGGKAYSDTYVDVNVYKRKHSAGIYGSTGTKSGFKGSGRGEAHAQSGISGSAGIGSGFGGHIGGFKKLH